MVKIKTEVTTTGPLFRGAAPQIMRAFIDEATDDVGQYAVDEVRLQLDRVLVNPTGYYRSQIQVRNLVETNLVTDGGVVYGPWLEGVGSRNESTRFKGYSTFRRVAPRVQQRVPDLVQPALNRAVGRLNG